MSDDHDLRLLQQVDATFRDQIRHMDQKASVVMAFIAGLFTLNRDGVRLAQDVMGGRLGPYQAFLLLLFGALFVSMGAAFRTIEPRVDRSVTSVLFWGNWCSDEDVATNERLLLDPRLVRGELVRDIRVMARIIRRKLAWLRWALFSLYAALVVFGGLAAARALQATALPKTRSNTRTLQPSEPS
jgi:hypothetical protein